MTRTKLPALSSPMETAASRRRPTLAECARFIAILVPALTLTACTSSDSVQAAHRALDRAFAHEPTAAFFEPVLARAQGKVPPPVPPQARQYYLMVVAEMQMLNERGKENLKRFGMLGDAYAMKLLSQWRLGRVEAARDTLNELRASGQEALNLRERWLAAAYPGVDQLERAIDASKEGATYDKIHELIAGSNGAWRALAAARSISTRLGQTPPELLETRLAAFKILKEAHDRAPDPALENAWQRMRAEAQIELSEFASLANPDAAAQAARVQRWQRLTGLDAPTR